MSNNFISLERQTKIAVRMPVLAYMREMFKVTDNILAYTPTHSHVAKQEPMTLEEPPDFKRLAFKRLSPNDLLQL